MNPFHIINVKNIRFNPPWNTLGYNKEIFPDLNLVNSNLSKYTKETYFDKFLMEEIRKFINSEEYKNLF
jgi:hypothetical protein